MRIQRFAGIAISGIALACATRAGTANTASPVNCPYNVLATVSNPRAVMYDVYYQDPARPPVIIGEVSPGSTVTFPLPGEGRGRVYVRRPPGDTTPERAGNPGLPLPDIRIRIHCAGA
jgi:hypothetical protein